MAVADLNFNRATLRRKEFLSLKRSTSFLKIRNYFVFNCDSEKMGINTNEEIAQ